MMLYSWWFGVGSVVIGDLDIVGVTVFPAEAETPLIVDPDAVLPRAGAFERFQAVLGGTRRAEREVAA